MPKAIATTAASNGVSATLRLRFLDFRIDVTTNSLPLATRLQTYFAPYIADGAGSASCRVRATAGEPTIDRERLKPWTRANATPTGAVPKESYYDARGGTRHILKNRTGVVIAMRGDDAVVVGELEKYANQVQNAICTLFGLSLAKRGYGMVHASAVVRRASGGALVFLGNSGSGKSSVALQLIELGGFDYLSNDRVLLNVERGVVRAVGLPKKPRVNPGTLLASRSLALLVSRPRRRAYEALGRDQLWKLEEKTDVDPSEAFGVGTRLEAPVEAIYALGWRVSGEGLAIEECDREAALAALMDTRKDFGVFDLAPEPARNNAALRKVASIAPVHAVTGRADPGALAEVVSRERS